MNTEQVTSYRTNERRDYYRHLTVFAVVNLILAALNLGSNPQRIWFVLPLFTWGYVLAIHTFSTLAEGTWLDPRREYHEILRLMEEDQQRFAKQTTRHVARPTQSA